MSQTQPIFEPSTPSPPPPSLSPATAAVAERAPNSKADFDTMVEFYLASNPYITSNRGTSELEVRFGTNPKSARPISKIDYDNVVQQLYAAGFATPDPDGLSILRIQNEYTNIREGETRISNIRAEVMGLDLIQEYCRTNNLQKLLDLPSTVSATADKIKFTQKMPPMVGGRNSGKPLRPVDFPDFNFRVSYQIEKDYTPRSDVAKQILLGWSDSKKLFRYINRVRLSHPDIPVFADISIIKGSPKTDRRVPIPYYTVQEAKLFTNQETYEIELEVDNLRVGPGTPFNTPATVLAAIRRCIRTVLGGLQGTNYPIAYSERDQVLQAYMFTVHGEEQYQEQKGRRILPRNFIGPSSYTLQLENIQTVNVEVAAGEGTNAPNIRQNYTVTDKADGERKLLYVAPNGRIYMIDTNMNVIFTGNVTQDKELHNSILDGEHIKYDKKGHRINLYAAFDIYFVNGKSVRELGFIPMEAEDEPVKFRLPILSNFIRILKPVSILDVAGRGNSDPSKTKESSSSHTCDFTIRCKEFYSSADVSIFNGCATILSKVRDGTYEYNTDGLIFTPTSTGVCSDRIGHAGPLHKSTWEASFKWKPPQFNTIDFLVSIKKDKTGKDEIHHVFQEGISLAGSQNLTQYKTLVLRCGFDERKHGYLNPMLDMIQDQIPSPGDIDNEDTYKPVAFQPTNPYDPTASLCNVELHDNGNGNLVLLTEEHEYFEEDTIVEFRYDITRSGAWKWVPLRVRYDKTNELRSGLKNYGNAYHVANGNWHSIHNPVSEDMIMTGTNIPETMAISNEDVYYNRSGKDTDGISTKPLRDFHNLFVKRKLIMGVSNRGNTLIDYAVGKAGDLPKWIAAKLDFVFGIDVSKDNIENHLDGACARYLNFRKKYHRMPGALFVNGNSGSNIRNAKAPISEKDKQITMAVFGQGPKDKVELGAGVYKWYGAGESGFHVSSCQFALHYFFENERTIHSFLRNVSECTRVGGHFIGTCYDGNTVFQMLRTKKRGDGISIMSKEKKIFEITKQYDQTGFPDDELSVGFPVDVFQESINKTFREFLVNFRYLTRIMEDYGFALIGEEDARAMGLPNATGLFDELYGSMMEEVGRDRRRTSEYGLAAKSMSAEEKRISFLNRYFVFRKMRNVNAEKIGKVLMRRGEEEEAEEEMSAAEIIKSEEADASAINRAKGPTKSVIRPIPGKKVKIVIGDVASSATIAPVSSAAVEPGVVFGKPVKIRMSRPKA